MSCSAVAPPGDIVAQPATVVGFDRRCQTTVEKLFRLLVGKGQLLTANLQKLIADAQIGKCPAAAGYATGPPGSYSPADGAGKSASRHGSPDY